MLYNIIVKETDRQIQYRLFIFIGGKMTNEKIKKLQLEIAKTTEAQKKSEQKYKEKIKGLRDELKKEEERLKRENDSLIGDIVRDLLGEVDADNIDSFREKIQLLTGLEDSEENERPKDNLQGDTEGIHSY